METIKQRNIVYTEEDVFFGGGINKYHYTKDGVKTLCGCKIKFGWKFDERNKVSLVDCKRCLKKMEKEKILVEEAKEKICSHCKKVIDGEPFKEFKTIGKVYCCDACWIEGQKEDEE